MPTFTPVQSRGHGRKADAAPDARGSSRQTTSNGSSGTPLFLQHIVVPLLQAKGLVNETGDGFEHDADAVADSVTSGRNGMTSRHGLPNARRPGARGTSRLDLQPSDAGCALSEGMRAEIEPILGADLSDVRVHDSANDRAAADGLRARAFTHQNHIWLGSNGRADDTRLLAHEATHVVHQSSGDGGGTAAPPIQRTPDASLSGAPVLSSPISVDAFPPGDITTPRDVTQMPGGPGGEAPVSDRPPEQTASARDTRGDAERKKQGGDSDGESGVRPADEADHAGRAQARRQREGPAGGDEPNTVEVSEPAAQAVPETGAGTLETGDLVLIDVELAEHERWEGALGRVGAAGSVERAEFIAEAAGGGFISGAASGLAMGLGIGLVSRVVPGIGPIIGGGLALHGLVTRDWAETAATIGRFGEGSDTYEVLANTIESVAAVIDVVSQILSAINGIVGVVQVAAAVIAGGAVIAAFFTFGATLGIAAVAADVVGVCEEISLAITEVTTVLDTINAAILRPCVTLFRALHAFTTQGDPREVEAQGRSISTAASASGGALGGWVGGKAAHVGAPRPAGPEEPPAPSQRPPHETPPPAAGDGPVVHYQEPPPAVHAEAPTPAAAHAEPVTGAAAPAPAQTMQTEPVATTPAAPDVTPTAAPAVTAPISVPATPAAATPAAAPTTPTPAAPPTTTAGTPAPAPALSEQLTLPSMGSQLRPLTAPIKLEGIKGTEIIPQGLQPGSIGTYGRAVPSPHEAALLSNPPGAPGATRGGGRMPATGREAAGVYLEHQTSAAVAHEVLPGHQYAGPQGQRRGGRDVEEALVIALPEPVKTVKDAGDAALLAEVRARRTQGEEVAPIEMIARSAKLTQDAIAQAGAAVPGTQVSRNFLAEIDQFNAQRFGYQEVRPGEPLPAGHPLRDATPAELDAFLNQTFDPFIQRQQAPAASETATPKPVQPEQNPNQLSFALGPATPTPSSGAAPPPGGTPPPAQPISGSAPPPSTPAPQRILVIGAERPEEFQYARDMRARGHDVTVVNPQATPESAAFAAQGGNFVQAPIESLPQRPGYHVMAEDFPVPIRGLFPGAPAFVAARISRLEPGGRWVVATEAPEFVRVLEFVAAEQGARVTTHEVPRYHEATPDSPHVVDRTRFIVTIDAPATRPAPAAPPSSGTASPPAAPSPASKLPTTPRASATAAPASVTPTQAPSGPTLGMRAQQVGALFLPQLFGGGGHAPTYAEREAEHRARFTADNQPAEGVERVNPDYPPPPATPAQITQIQNEIMNLLAVRAEAEQEAQRQSQRADVCEENQAPIQQSIADTTAGMSAVKAHNEAIARREAVNQEQQQRQQESQGLVAGYPSRATGLLALSAPLAAWEGFTDLASHLPGDAGDSMLRMNHEAREMQKAFDKMAAHMTGAERKGPGNQAHLQDDQQRLEQTGDQAQESDVQLHTAQDGALGLRHANESALAESNALGQAATGRAQESGDAAAARQEEADSLAEQLRVWAAAHAEARRQSIAASAHRLQTEGKVVTITSER